MKFGSFPIVIVDQFSFVMTFYTFEFPWRNLMTRNTLSSPVTENRLEGMQFIANFKNCSCDPIHLTQIDYLLERCVQEVENSGLKTLANRFHQFEGSGVTGVILLAESHFAFHTWSEIRLVTFDLYVCNFLQDNTEKASKLHAAMKLFWNPLVSEEHIISRGKLR